MNEQAVPGYAELRTLGSGGFGRVVLARHDATGTMVAIKYLRADLLGDPEFAALFRGEAEVLGSLSDPCVVRLYEYLEWPGGAAIVMELVDGTTVREILRRYGKTSPEAAIVVLYGSLLGLAAAHARGVVHRDYKPENVLVNELGGSKLTDFGISARSGTRPVSAGSLAYAPPEQFDGTPASPASDVYAATATFYECLAGRPPFTGASSQALMSQYRFASVPLDAVPEPLRPVVALGMAKNPAYRPADAAALAGSLRAAATAAYGPDWEQRGRSQLGEAALLLAALWPTGGAPSPSGFTAEQVRLARGHQGPQHEPQPGLQHGGHPSAHAPSQAVQHQQHVHHVLHLKHLAHLRYLRRQHHGATAAPRKASTAASRIGLGLAGAAAIAVAAAAGTVVGTRTPAGATAQVPAAAGRHVYPVSLDAIRPGDYPVNRQISAVSPWVLTLTDIRVLGSGQAEFFVQYLNTGAVTGQLTCANSAAQEQATLTFGSGQTMTAIADDCSQHPNDSAIYVGAGQTLQSYAIFADASKLGQSFTLNWPAGNLSGAVDGLRLPS